MALLLAFIVMLGYPLQILAADEARYKAEMLTEQDIFRDTVGDLNVVRGQGTKGEFHLSALVAILVLCRSTKCCKGRTPTFIRCLVCNDFCHQDGPLALRPTLTHAQLVSNCGLYVDLGKMEAVVAEVRSLDERLKKADRDAGVFNSREQLLGLPPTDYSMLKKVIETFDPFFQFWTTAHNWRTLHKSWMHDSWEKLHGETVEREVTNAYKVCVWGAGGGGAGCRFPKLQRPHWMCSLLYYVGIVLVLICATAPMRFVNDVLQPTVFPSSLSYGRCCTRRPRCSSSAAGWSGAPKTATSSGRRWRASRSSCRWCRCEQQGAPPAP